MSKRSAGQALEIPDEPLGRKVAHTRTRKHDRGRFFYSQPYKVTKHLLDPNLVQEPNPPPVNCNTHLFFNTYAIRRDALLSDAYSLLAEFVQRETTDFSAFKEIWLEKNFSLIHLLCPSRYMRDRFMFVLYQTFFTFLYQTAEAKFPQQNISRPLKLGVIFALYMLYYTQPDFSPPILILVDANQWNVLNLLYQYFGSNGLSDGVYAFGKLREAKAFGFSLYIEHTPFYYQQSKLGFDGFLPDISDEPRYQQFNEKRTSHFTLLDDKLAALENSFTSTQLGGFIDESIISELQSFEEKYENAKSKLVDEEIATGLNQPVADTLMIPGFQKWLAARNNDQGVTASLYFRHIVSDHLKEKYGDQQPETFITNNTDFGFTDELLTPQPHVNHSTSGSVDDPTSALRHERGGGDKAVELEELETLLHEQMEQIHPVPEVFDENTTQAVSKTPDATSPCSTASTVYSFDSE
ncbi:hypothetical protein DSO57_1027850 [Entomophthora muscae]|uniref:Uncharacterized protein n=1 Tax=Entomophthora muscae TaxID=34485 RepID=A0ACC2SEE2_9FUNG|nr:hypothetical protein DSO57_1027850 [Entomophthora muscae]